MDTVVLIGVLSVVKQWGVKNFESGSVIHTVAYPIRFSQIPFGLSLQAKTDNVDVEMQWVSYIATNITSVDFSTRNQDRYSSDCFLSQSGNNGNINIQLLPNNH